MFGSLPPVPQLPGRLVNNPIRTQDCISPEHTEWSPMYCMPYKTLIQSRVAPGLSEMNKMKCL